MRIKFPVPDITQQTTESPEPTQWEALKETGHFRTCPEFIQNGNKYNNGMAHDTAFPCRCAAIAELLDEPLWQLDAVIVSIELSETQSYIFIGDRLDKDLPVSRIPIPIDIAEQLCIGQKIIVRTSPTNTP
jgi:hypothetical protein